MKRRKRLALTLCILGVFMFLLGCENKSVSESENVSESEYVSKDMNESADIKEELVGSWYEEGSSTPTFTLYSDGTCKIDNEYGTGTWSVVNENLLKLTNYYGESNIAIIVSVEDGYLILENEDKSATVQLWNTLKSNETRNDDTEQEANTDEINIIKKYNIVDATDEITIIRFRDENNNFFLGLMNADGEIYFQFPNSSAANHISDDYIYGNTSIYSLDGTLLYQFPDGEGDIDYEIVSYGNDIFMVKCHITNMTTNVTKLGFICPTGEWIIEPTIEALDGDCQYIGDGYFCNYGDNDTVLFINPETKSQFQLENIHSIRGFTEGVAVATRNDRMYAPICGIDLQQGTIIEYSSSSYLISVGNGYIATGNYDGSTGGRGYHDVRIYNVRGQEVLYISEYDFLQSDKPYISDGCIIGRIKGADKKGYISKISIATGEFSFEPVRGELGVQNGDYALIRDSSNYYILDFSDGSLEEINYWIEVDYISENYSTIFKFRSYLCKWVDGKIYTIVPYIVSN